MYHAAGVVVAIGVNRLIRSWSRTDQLVDQWTKRINSLVQVTVARQVNSQRFVYPLHRTAHLSRNAIGGKITNNEFEMTLDQYEIMKASAKQCDRETRGHYKHPLPGKQQGRRNSSLIPDNNTETPFAEWLFVPLKECRVVKRSLAALHIEGTDKNTQKPKVGVERTVQTKHSQHHLPPSASTALIPSRMLFLHFLHFGILNRT